MDEDKTIVPIRHLTGDRTVFFGLSASDPALKSLNLVVGLAQQGDCRNLTAAGMAASPFQRAICPLFAYATDLHNDAIAVIEALVLVRYKGEVIVLAPTLLRPKMVENELRGLAKGMRLTLMAGVLPPLTDI